MTKKTVSKQEIKPETAAQRFHRQIAEIAPLLKSIPDWRIQLFKMLPDYDSYRGGLLLKNVLSGNSTDMAILDALQKITKTKK